MKKSKVKWMMSFCTIGLIGVCALIYLWEDRIGPDILFEEEDVRYEADMSAEDLLSGVSAVDLQDCDVSESLRVSQVMEFPEDGYVIVTYIAKDLSNNVSKMNRRMILE